MPDETTGLPTDADGRFVWIVTWGRPGRVDWRTTMVAAYDAEEALARAREAAPGRLPPDAAMLASAPSARSYVTGQRARTST